MDAPERREQILPPWEMSDLQDYRLRYATYHSDPALKNLRYAYPFNLLVQCYTSRLILTQLFRYCYSKDAVLH